MIGRPIGLNHSEDCDNAEWYWLCDDCRTNARRDLGDPSEDDEC